MPIWSKNLARLPLILLAVVEVTALFLSVYLARALALNATGEHSAKIHLLTPDASIIAFVVLLSLIAMGLYEFHQRINFREVLARLVVGIALGALVLTATYFVFPSIRVEPRIAALSALTALGFLFLIRYGFSRYFDTNVFRRRTLVLGAGVRSAPISELRRRADRRGFKVVAKVPASGDTTIRHCPYLVESGENLLDIARERHAEEIVIAMDDRRGTLPTRQLLDCKLQGINVIDLLEFLERETGKIWLQFVEPGWLILSPGFRVSRFRDAAKRTFDIIFASVAVILLSPVMLVIAAAIKLTEGLDAPIIYSQRRVGRRGVEFNVLKFRSMSVDAEADGRARWAAVDDDRVTVVGALIRRNRLDELPQFFNVLAGQMSLVGPRPERPEFVADLRDDLPYYAERHTVKPGLTGWAQLKYAYGSSRNDALEKLQYDLYYVKNHNLLLDLIIILQTVEVVLWGKGAR